MSKKHFAHLHVHSQYSFLDGMNRLEDIFSHAKNMNQNAMAITDHGNCAGILKAYDCAKSADVKYIIGMEAYVTEKHGKKDASGKVERKHMIILVQNEVGYHNFLHLQYVGHKAENMNRGKPTLSYQDLANYSEGIIATSACVAGVVAKHIFIDHDPSEAMRQAKILRDIYDGRFYMELQATNWGVQKEINKYLIQIANKLHIPLICSVDSHYTCHKDHDHHDMLLAIQSKRVKTDPTRVLKFPCEDYYLQDESEILQHFSDSNIVYRTGEIADMCDQPIWLEHKDTYQLPTFPIEEEKDVEQFRTWQYANKNKYDGFTDDIDFFLLYKCIEKFKDLLPHKKKDPEYFSRLWSEINIIKNKKLSSYMLIVSDYVNAAKNSGVEVGPGRGSSASSIVAYVLGITEVDPIKYGLLFSRFINEERSELADIDVDFSSQARVREYLKQKYGEDRISLIANYQQMKPKVIIKDVARSMNLGGSKSEAHGIANHITKELPENYEEDETHESKKVVTIDDALKASKIFVAATKEYPGLLEYCRSMEGLYRQPGVHAAGIIIAPEPLQNILPMSSKRNKHTGQYEWVCQYDGKTLEKAGYLKADILKLDTLRVIQDSIKDIERFTGKDFPEWKNISENDPNVLQMISEGHLPGLFQLEKSESMRDVAMNIKPDSIEEISLIIALNRPGPMASGMHDEYPNRKFKRRPVSYPHIKMEEALKETLGILVYEEQAQKIARDLAGFSLGEGDNIRKVCKLKGKHGGDKLLEELKTKFIAGCQKTNGMSINEANKMFKLIEAFQGYGFNHAHSVAYATLAYRTAYLKYYYPSIFLNACLKYAKKDTMKNIDWPNIYRKECRRLGIKILTPDINGSDATYTVIDDKTIRMGLSSAKGVGYTKDDYGNEAGAAMKIIKSRPFHSVEDFIVKTTGQRININVVKALNSAGAFDSLNVTKYDMDNFYADARKKVQQLINRRFKDYKKKLGRDLTDEDKKLLIKGNILDGYKYEFPNESEWADTERLKREMEIFGECITGDLSALYGWFFTHIKDPKVSLIDTIKKYPNGKRIKMEVLIKNISKKGKHRKGRHPGEQFAILEVEDANKDTIDLCVWAPNYAEFQEDLQRNNLIKFIGSVSINKNRNNKRSIYFEKILPGHVFNIMNM